MTNHQLYKRTLSGFIVFALLTCISIAFIDKPLSLWIHSSGLDSWALKHGLQLVTMHMPMISIGICLIVVIFIKPKFSIGNKKLYITYLFSLTILTLIVKQLAKNCFGRYWPQTWIHNNRSLLHDNFYGFDWFHGAIHNNGSFPSGHTTFIAVLSLSMLITYPKLNKLWYALMLIMISSLVILNYHFLGDCFAALGLSLVFANLGFIIYRKIINKI